MAQACLECPLCGAQIPDEAGSCRDCGGALPSREGEPEHPAFEAALAGRFPGRILAALGAAGSTAASVALHPACAFRSFRFGGPIAPAILFSILLGGPCLVIDAAWGMLLAGEGRRPSGPAALALFLAVPPVYVYLRAQIIHLGLVLSGRATESFAGTLRVTAYANASVAPLLALPVVGEFLFLLAGAMVEATGLRACHRLSFTKAIAAEVVPAVALASALLAGAFLGLLWWSQAPG